MLVGEFEWRERQLPSFGLDERGMRKRGAPAKAPREASRDATRNAPSAAHKASSEARTARAQRRSKEATSRDREDGSISASSSGDEEPSESEQLSEALALVKRLAPERLAKKTAEVWREKEAAKLAKALSLVEQQAPGLLVQSEPRKRADLKASTAADRAAAALGPGGLSKARAEQARKAAERTREDQLANDERMEREVELAALRAERDAAQDRAAAAEQARKRLEDAKKTPPVDLSEEQERERPKGRPKLQEMTKLDANADKAAFKVWEKEYDLWYKVHQEHYKEQELLTALLKALPAELKGEVMVEVDITAADATCEKVVKNAAMLKGLDSFLEAREARRNYRQAARNGRESLIDFVKRWRLLYSKAKVVGNHTVNDETDAQDLLESARLTPAQLATQLAKQDLTVVGALEYLSSLGRALEATGTRPFGSGKGEGFTGKRERETDPQHAANVLYGDQAKRQRTGPEPTCMVCGKTQDKHRKTEKYPKGEWCKRNDGKGKGAGKGFGKGAQQGAAKGTGASGTWRAGDWECPNCKDHQFSKNEKCRKCGAAKPAGAGKREGGAASKREPGAAGAPVIP